MKTTKLTVALAGLLFASAAIVSSCKKKDNTEDVKQDTSSGTASDNTQAEQHSTDAETIGSDAIDNNSLSTFKLAGGELSDPFSGSVNITGAGTGTVVVTFSSYVGRDGRTRNGSLIYTMSPATAHYRDAGMVMTVATTTANIYTVDNNTVTINKTVKNTWTGTGNLTWGITSNVTVAKASGGTFTWNATRTHELLNTAAITYDGASYNAAYNGTGTPINWTNTDSLSGNPNGAIIQINGSASGTSADGVAYSVTTSNVVRNHNCCPDATRPHFHPFVAGTVDFTPTGKTTRIINYGSGACDLTYTISIGSWSTTVSW